MLVKMIKYMFFFATHFSFKRYAYSFLDYIYLKENDEIIEVHGDISNK